MKFTKSNRILKQSLKVIPNACQTLSKGYKMFLVGKFPLFVSKAKGCYIWDVDGNKYIDYNNALAPIIIGYNIEEINKSVIKQLRQGVVFSLPHKIELELTNKLIAIIPCAQMVRLVKNGADATSAAVRIARAYTGKDMILRAGYHGAQDWYLASQPPQDLGVPKAMKKLIDVFEYNNLESLKEKIKNHKGKIAAIIMEPVPMDTPLPGYLKAVKAIAHKNNILLIFDEIVTGFRMSLGGAQEYYKVTPDLGCFGKAMANGFPISCVVGKKQIMKQTEDVFVSSTFGGECLSMAAALATIRYLEKHNVIEHTWKVGGMLYDGIIQLIKKYHINAHIIGQKFKFKIIFNNVDGSESKIKKLFFLQQAVFGRIFFGTSVTFNYNHKPSHIRLTLSVIEKIFKEIAKHHDNENEIKNLLQGNMHINKFFRDQR